MKLKKIVLQERMWDLIWNEDFTKPSKVLFATSLYLSILRKEGFNM